jgi:ETFB lysine methyltransferase
LWAATIVDVSNFGPTIGEFEHSLQVREKLVDDLRRRFDVVEHRIGVGNQVFELLHPRSADDLIDEDEFNRDERLPYWAEIWPSAYVLAQRIAEQDGSSIGRPRRLLELGCGSGLAVVIALAAGFEVTAIDYYPAALEFVHVNAELNSLPRPQTRVVDWRNYPTDLRGFDIVIAADVLYETGYCRLIAEAFRQSLVADGIGLLTDPQRSKAAVLPDECRKAGLKISQPQVFGPLSVPGGDPAVKQTVDLFEIRHAD